MADAAGLPVVLEALGGRKSEFKGMLSYTLDKAQLLEALGEAKSAGYQLLSDIFGIDYLTYPGHGAPGRSSSQSGGERSGGKRFTVVYNLYQLSQATRLFIRTDLDDGETLPTVTGLWKAAAFMEREVYDMFGFEFEGHPDLRKLLTPEDLDGHPHRKDFPIGESPTLFNDGRYLDPPSFRAAIMGSDGGLTGWKGGARKGVRREQDLELVAHEITGQQGGSE